MPISIGHAASKDAAKIAAFHADVWRQTHLDLAPPDVLKTLDTAHRLRSWQGYFAADEARQHSLIARQNGAIVGLVHFGLSHNPVFQNAGQIKHLYVAQACQGQGTGRQLFEQAFAQLHKDGFNSVALAVARGNDNALGFYQHMGGRITGGFTDAGPIWRSDNLIISWPSLNPPPEQIT